MNLLNAQEVKEKPPLYKINIGDTMRIGIYGKADAAKDITVDPYGNITYLYVGTVKAYGKTFPELTKELNEKFKGVLKFSLITVTPIQLAGAISMYLEVLINREESCFLLVQRFYRLWHKLEELN